MPDSEEGRYSRLAVVEAKLTENIRQQEACWRRLDEQEKDIEKLRLDAVDSNARISERLSSMEKAALREEFTMKAKIAEIGWRVGLIVSVALFILNMVIRKVNITDLFSTPQQQVRKH